MNPRIFSLTTLLPFWRIVRSNPEFLLEKKKAGGREKRQARGPQTLVEFNVISKKIISLVNTFSSMEYFLFVNDFDNNRVKFLCNPDDLVGDIKMILSNLTGWKAEKIRLSSDVWSVSATLRDGVALEDYEIKSGFVLHAEYLPE